jgi:hypothetical protein
MRSCGVPSARCLTVIAAVLFIPAPMGGQQPTGADAQVRANITQQSARTVAPADTGRVQLQMEHVDFHVDQTAVLHIRYLRGELLPTSQGSPPYFDDKRSFVLSIDSARIGISAAALGDVLNRYTFAYPGSPLRRLSVTVEEGRIRQTGVMRGVSFTILADLLTTPQGDLRLHPTSIKVAGLPVGGLMKFLGLELQGLMDVRRAHGIRLEHNDFLLSPAELLPPPGVRGHLAAVEVHDSEIVQVFTPAGRGASARLVPPDTTATNYMYFRGGVLRFSSLTMNGANLQLVGTHPRGPFEFYLDRYTSQLAAGYIRTMSGGAVVAYLPNYRDTPAPLASGPSRQPAADPRRERANDPGAHASILGRWALWAREAPVTYPLRRAT